MCTNRTIARVRVRYILQVREPLPCLENEPGFSVYAVSEAISRPPRWAAVASPERIAAEFRVFHSRVTGVCLSILSCSQKQWLEMVMLLMQKPGMGLVRSIARQVTVLHQGSVLAEGTMDQVANDPDVIKVYLGEEA